MERPDFNGSPKLRTLSVMLPELSIDNKRIQRRKCVQCRLRLEHKHWAFMQLTTKVLHSGLIVVCIKLSVTCSRPSAGTSRIAARTATSPSKRMLKGVRLVD